MFAVLGFLPGYVGAKILSAFGVLRVPKAVELAGLDLGEIHSRALDKQQLPGEEYFDHRGKIDWGTGTRTLPVPT